MKRPLSRLEKLFLWLPIAGALIAWQWASLHSVLYRLFPGSALPYSSGTRSGQFSPDGTLIYATTSAGPWPRVDSTTSVWDAKTGLRLWHYSSGYRTWRVHFSPDSKLLARVDFGSIARSGRYYETPDSRVILFEAKSGKILRSFKKRKIYTAAFVDKGRKLWCEGNPALLLDAVTGKTLLSIPTETELTANNYISRNHKIAVLMRDVAIKKVDHEYVEVWDLVSARRIRKFPQNFWLGYRRYDLSANGRYLFVWDSHRKNRGELWDVTSGTRIRTLPQRIITDAHFAPDGQNLLIEELLKATKNKSNFAKFSVSDVRTGRTLWKRIEPTDKEFTIYWMQNLRFMPDSENIVFDGSRGIFLLDARTGKTLKNTAPIHGENPVASPDSKHLIVSSGGLRIKSLPD